MCVREQTFSLRHKLELSLFLSKGKHPALARTPQEFCSALPGQSSERPNLPPDQKLFQLFSFLSAVSPVNGECLSKHASDWGSEDSIVQRANCQVGRLSEQPLQLSFSIAGPWPFSIVACSRAFWCSAVKSSNRDMHRQGVHASGRVKDNPM